MNKKKIMNKKQITNRFIIGTFVSLYVIVSVISTIHVIEFFRLSNPKWLAVSLAIAFEIGAAASLAAIIALDRMSKWMVWSVFIILTLMQMMGNTYYTYSHVENYQGWAELFGLAEEDPIFQKRILSLISGAILPVIALGFIKSLVDYIRPEKTTAETTTEPVKETVEEISEDQLWETASLTDLQDSLREEADITENLVPVAAAITPEILSFLQKTGELTPEDIENYKRSTKNPGGEEVNPQILPGVN